MLVAKLSPLSAHPCFVVFLLVSLLLELLENFRVLGRGKQDEDGHEEGSHFDIVVRDAFALVHETEQVDKEEEEEREHDRPARLLDSLL